MDRRLAVILAADVVGYSALMEKDEAGTFERLKEHHKELFEPEIARHHGRIFKLMGDGLLAEFGSVVDAVECAVSLQRGLAERNTNVAADRRVEARIGINLGEVIVDGDDRYGEGVNIAARLEQLAEPGGICVSGKVAKEVEKKLSFGFESMGAQHVKNISEPIPAFRVKLEGMPRPAGLRRFRGRAAAVGVLVVLAMVASVGTWWSIEKNQSSPLATVLRQWATLLPWKHPNDEPPPPGKPSIAVLPFANLSDDSEQAYFAQGLADDLITDMSKISGLLVIARNSTSTYHAPPSDVRDVAQQLGVHYVLEGSVRRSGDSVRINVQLIDGATGSNLWAERYDRAYAQIFTLQDEVIGRIIDALSVRLTEGERSQIARLPTRNLEAYDNYTRAEQKAYELTEQSLREALILYQKSIALDPQFSDAYAGYARALVDVVSFDYQPVLISTVARQQAYDAAERALQLNAQTPRAYAALAILQSLDGDHDKAIASAQKAVALAPNSADAELNIAIVLIYAGLQPEALTAMERVLQLNPKPQSQVYDYYALALFMNKRYEEAAKAVRSGGVPESDLGLEVLAMTYAQQGQQQNAHDIIEAIFKRSPGANLAGFRVVYGHHRRVEDLDFRINSLREAGMPEWPYGFTGSSADRLDEAAIRNLAIDKLWVGHQHGGAAFVMQIDGRGNYAQRGSQGLTTGKILFRGNLMCMQSGAVAIGREFCSPIYRNPKGSRQSQDEYVFPDLAAVWYFSVGA